jgi:hypothetical protein
MATVVRMRRMRGRLGAAEPEWSKGKSRRAPRYYPFWGSELGCGARLLEYSHRLVVPVLVCETECGKPVVTTGV